LHLIALALVAIGRVRIVGALQRITRYLLALLQPDLGPLARRRLAAALGYRVVLNTDFDRRFSGGAFSAEDERRTGEFAVI